MRKFFNKKTIFLICIFIISGFCWLLFTENFIGKQIIDSEVPEYHKNSYPLAVNQKIFPNNKLLWFVPGKGMIYVSNDSLKNKIYRVRTDDIGAIRANKDRKGIDGNILFLGDSVASAIFTSEKNRSSSQLQSLFTKDVKVTNLSHPFQSTLESIDLLNYHGQRKKYDYVILFGSTETIYYLRHFGSFYNNYYDSYYIQSDIQSLTGFEKQKQNFKNKIIELSLNFTPALTNIYTRFDFLDYIKMNENKLIPIIPTFTNHSYVLDIREEASKKQILQEYQNALELYVVQSLSLGIKPVLIIDYFAPSDEIDKNKFTWLVEYMEKVNDTPYEDFTYIHDKMIESAKLLCVEMEVICIDTKEMANKEYLYDLKHLNDKGNKLLAEKIYEKISNDELF